MALRITHNTRSANTLLRPITKNELREFIKVELERQGPDADLNDIDTSLITDMSFLFCGPDIYIRKIKINKWDVSNVTDMKYMFTFCDDFNCDLGGWNVSNVENMEHMFDFCCSLRNLPLWFKDEQVRSLTSMKKEQNKTPSLISTIAAWSGMFTLLYLIYNWFFT